MYIRANINGWYTVLHLNEGETEAKVIAFPPNEGEANFMVKALNHYEGPRITKNSSSIELEPEDGKNDIDNEIDDLMLRKFINP